MYYIKKGQRYLNIVFYFKEEAEYYVSKLGTFTITEEPPKDIFISGEKISYYSDHYKQRMVGTIVSHKINEKKAKILLDKSGGIRSISIKKLKRI